MLIASLVIVVVANLGDDPNIYHPQNWSGPTESDLTTCAQMADDLNAGFSHIENAGLPRDWQDKYATCEIRIGADDAGAKKVAYKF